MIFTIFFKFFLKIYDNLEFLSVGNSLMTVKKIAYFTNKEYLIM